MIGTGRSRAAEPRARELGERLRRKRPSLQVLYISGHTGDEVARRLLLDDSIPVLQKPFPPDELVERVQEQLELSGMADD